VNVVAPFIQVVKPEKMPGQTSSDFEGESKVTLDGGGDTPGRERGNPGVPKWNGILCKSSVLRP
jgi:hypothetical protein